MSFGNDINVKIGATDSTAAAFKSAENRMKSLAGTAKSMMGALGAGLSVGAITGMVKGAIDFGSSIDDAAVATQTHVEALQVLRYAATQAGASTGQMDKALIKLNDSAYAASIGSQAEANALVKLGISAQAFAALSPEKRMEALATAIVKAKDQNLAMSAAMDLMGKNAPFLMAVLQQLGKDGFGALKKDAQSAGQVMSEDMIKQLDAAGNEIEKFKTKMTIKVAAPATILLQKAVKFAGTDESIASMVERKLSSRAENHPGGTEDDSFADWVFKKFRNQEPPANEAAGFQPYRDAAGVLRDRPDNGAQFFQDAAGQWQKKTAGAGGEQLAGEIQRTAEINVRLAEKLRETNNRAETALNQVKSGRN